MHSSDIAGVVGIVIATALYIVMFIYALRHV